MNLDGILGKTKDISVAIARFEHGFYHATELIFLGMIIILLLYRRLALISGDVYVCSSIRVNHHDVIYFQMLQQKNHVCVYMCVKTTGAKY